ncbi:MAG: YqeG family HAD IIIA-type phosphatase [Oscillospiraceae bacterium]|nr:YqeG family HAD IIIA-type phosphatase [Oscillospiraceae bacterium]
MLEKLFPDIIYESIYDIDFCALKRKGISGLILDIDNTLIKPSERRPGDRLLGWLKSLEEGGFQFCVLSNAGRKRTEAFARGLDIFAIHKAGKPSKKGFYMAMEIMRLERSEVCMVGDQLFTDVLGAKRLGIYCIYTKPIVFREVFTVMLKRLPEAVILKLFYMRHGKKTVSFKPDV